MGYREVEFFLGYAMTEREVEECLERHGGTPEGVPAGALIEDKANAVLEAVRLNARVSRVFSESGEPDTFVLRVRRFMVQPYETSPQNRVSETERDKRIKARLGVTGPFVFQAFA